MTHLARTLSPDEITRLHQQELVANFGVFAMTALEVNTVLHEACLVAVQGLQTPMAKVLQYRPASNDLLVVAGVGWENGVVGTSTLDAGMGSPAGFALVTAQPVLSNNLQGERRFQIPALLADHSVQSAINVVIGLGAKDAFGVLEVDSTRQNEFTASDMAFLQSLANVLGAGLMRAEAERANHELLRDKDLLMQEVHHRVKNSLQLVHTMLKAQARTATVETKRHLDGAAVRIVTIGAVHQRLYSGASVARAEASEFLQALLGDMQSMLAHAASPHSIRLEAPVIQLPADEVTPLGLVVSELVTNAAKYGAGNIVVRLSEELDGLQVVVEDEGPGFPESFQLAASTGFGMRLIATLAKGTPAAVEIDRSVPHARIKVLLRHEARRLPETAQSR